MRVLLTGASGYLGGNLLRHLMRERPAWDVHATFFSIEPSSEQPNAHWLDLRDPECVRRVVAAAAPDLILHTAALNAGEADEMMATNARGSAAVADAAVARGARLVHVSSDVVFDGERGNYTEADPPHPITPYAVSKAEAERAVLERDGDVVVVRTSLIYGFKPLDPRTRAVLRGDMPQLFTDEMRCPIWVDNLSAALLELAETDYRGILHVAGPQAQSRYEFGVKLVRALGGDPSGLVAARSADAPAVRPRDCTLDTTRARERLGTRLMSVDEVLAPRSA